MSRRMTAALALAVVVQGFVAARTDAAVARSVDGVYNGANSHSGRMTFRIEHGVLVEVFNGVYLHCYDPGARRFGVHGLPNDARFLKPNIHVKADEEFKVHFSWNAGTGEMAAKIVGRAVIGTAIAHGSVSGHRKCQAEKSLTDSTPIVTFEIPLLQELCQPVADRKSHSTSSNMRKHIKFEEAPHGKPVLHLYNDPVGHCTIGWGHLVHLGPCNGSESVDLQGEISEAKAEDLLSQDLAKTEKALNDAVHVPLNQNQFDALVDWAFNVQHWPGSSLLVLLNCMHFDDIPDELRRWVYAHDKDGKNVKLPGLVNRRDFEASTFGGSK